ncbi:nucleoid-associated protein [Ferrimicrobium sp.]|uniref:nucleoid-associated protein n=1 Tax=Ferrimicrobium sp. TaxID=2926050 RepID=UPI00260D7A95|nr:nucleoid-associated protein [Ferrimicrobium sp.]
MARDLGRLRVKTVIVHEVPYHLATGASGEPVLSEVESPLTQDVRNFFKERIASSLGSAAYDVELDGSTTSPVPRLILDNLTSRKNGFVAMSQEMARHLYLCQKGNSPEGLLTVCEVTIGDQGGLAVLKLEKEEGARVELADTEGGRTLSVQHLHDLMLTERTKVFKVGLFVQTGDDRDSIEGSVCDTQRGYGGTVAHFFLEQFLGCRLREQPEITTKRFFDTTESFINDEIADPETKTRYQVALLAELNGTRDKVSIRAFANNNLDVDDRKPFMDRIEEARLPSTEFDKDNHLVRSRLRRIQIAFESGVSVLASPENIGEQVKIVTDSTNGQTTVEITDRLKRMNGRN